MPDVSAPAHKDIFRLSFYFFSRIGRWPVCHHLDFVAFVAWINALVFFFISRSHLSVARRAAIQFHEMFLPKIDVLFPVSAIAHRFFE